MTLTETAINGVFEIEPKVFGDNRGWFYESYSKEKFEKLGITSEFIQDNRSFSAQKGTLRGLHCQTNPKAQAKLVTCLKGAILDVAVDIFAMVDTDCIYDKYGTYGMCIRFGVMNHTVFAGNLSCGIIDDGEFDINPIWHFCDCIQPTQMRRQRPNRQPHQYRIHLCKSRHIVLKCDKFCGTYGGKVCGVRKEYDPFSGKIRWKVQFSIC